VPGRPHQGARCCRGARWWRQDEPPWRLKGLPHTATLAGAAFGGTLMAAQTACYYLKVTAAVPLAPATVGVAAIGLASAAAGQAGKMLDRAARTGRGPSARELRREDNVREAAVDFVLGALLFKTLGGRFRVALPSDVRYPGAFARESIPAAGREYANESQRRQLVALYRRLGCHHCGSRAGRPIGDHMPPNKSAHGGRDGTKGPLNWQDPEEVVNRFMRDVVPGGAARFPPPRQRYYPQCESCSSKQSTAMRVNRQVIVRHFGGWNGSYLGGLLPSVRHMGDYAGGSGWGSGPRSWQWRNVRGAVDRAFGPLLDGVAGAVAAPVRAAQEVGDRLRRIRL